MYRSGFVLLLFPDHKGTQLQQQVPPFLMSTKHDKKSTVYCVELCTQTTLQVPFTFSLKTYAKLGRHKHRLRSLVFDCLSARYTDWTTHDRLNENHETFHTGKSSPPLWKPLPLHHRGYVLLSLSYLLLCHVLVHTNHGDTQMHVPWLLCSVFTSLPQYLCECFVPAPKKLLSRGSKPPGSWFVSSNSQF